MEKTKLYKYTFSVTLQDHILQYVKKTYGGQNIIIKWDSALSIAAVSNSKEKKELKGGNLTINTKTTKEGFLYLSKIGEIQINTILRKEFKKSFRDYMAGALSCNQNLQIKFAILSFCKYYDIQLNNSLYELLRKDWNRYINRDSPSEMALSLKQDIY